MHNRESIYKFLKHIICEQTNIPENEIDFDSGFDEYGIDSLMMMKMTDELNVFFKTELSRTLFFEYKNIKELTDYLLDLDYEEDKTQKIISDEINEDLFDSSNDELSDSTFVVEARKNTDIAIIGISGLFPGANNVDELWENLLQGKDCVTKAADYLVNDNKIYCKYGGFIDNVDKFDPLFFRILPKEAMYIDPQIRLFLQETWHAIEDAGYSADSLKGKKVGVFVGAMWGQYQNFGIEETMKGNSIAFDSSFASIANRVSYYFDFTGPSMAIDSMCSSSLTAIHLACQSILNTESDIAIVGGVNLNLHQSKFISICQGKFASTIGKCQSFGENGDGYVPGEGIVSIVLKPLNKALNAHDNIYGIIKSSCINHGGRTSGYTVPNPNAQEEVISNAMNIAGISPLDVSYIEAHGTGTKLGDPIEINSLDHIYKIRGKKSCAIGSIKSNIGHLEAASGLAGIVKVLLQLKYKKIVPSLHSTKLNPYINFSETAFYVPQQLEEWKSNGPRRAGVSSFGAGGSNSHIIIEEFIPQRSNYVELSQYLFILSAESKAQIIEYIKAYIVKLPQIQDLFSMQLVQAIGRIHFKYRVCFLYHDKTELEKKLIQIINDASNMEILYAPNSLGCYKGEKDLISIGNAWLQGYEINWRDLFSIEDCYKLSLPSYPFKKEKIWYKEEQGSKMYNVTNVSENLCEISIIDTSLYNDHSTYGYNVLPGTFFIEVCLNIVKEILGIELVKIDKVIWNKTADIETKIMLRMSKDDNVIRFEFFSKNNVEQTICTIKCVQVNKVNRINYQQPVLKKQLTHDQIYEIFAKNGIHYGNTFRNLNSILFGDHYSKAKLEKDLESVTYILDAALQAAIPLQINKKCLPMEIEEIIFYKPFKELKEIIVNRKYSEENIYDITIMNNKDEMVCSMSGVLFLENKCEYDLYKTTWKEKSQNIISHVTNTVVYLGNSSYQLLDDIESVKINIVKNVSQLQNRESIIYEVCNSDEVFNQIFNFTKSIISYTSEIKIIIIGKINNEKFYKEFCALEGFVNSIERENTNLHFKLILCGEGERVNVAKEFTDFSEKVILYKNSKRYIRCVKKIDTLSPRKNNDPDEGGVYIICGGGKLSEKIGRYLIETNPNIKIIVLKRHIENQIKSDFRVIACDLLDYNALKNILSSIRVQNRIRGIIFTAGIVKDSLFINKDIENAYEVINTKIKAIENINMLTKDDMLDFFIILSSMAGILGNVGQSDYAYANAYLNYFSELRNKAVENGELYGRTVSFSFPLVDAGGMTVSQENAHFIEKETGLKIVPFHVFKKAFAMCDKLKNNIILCYGNRNVYHQIISQKELRQRGKRMYDKKDIHSKVLNIFLNETGMDHSQINIEDVFFSYGVESVNVMSITSELEDIFNTKLSPAFLYEHNTIKKVIDYFTEKQNDEMSIHGEEYSIKSEKMFCENNIENTDIAIIGISGRFGHAENMEALNKLLEKGKSAVEIIPSSRWNNQKYYSKNKALKGKYYNQYGSFIEDYKMFDAAFFNISPDEASEMDPQQRIFLEEAWKCVEDAGYAISNLSSTKVGVYVGAMWTMYQLYGYDSCKKGEFKYANSSLSSIANRVSYEFNFNGPSITLDTMCSSTLTALYLACRDILSNECEYSIVGGVNLSLHPYKYLDLCDKKFLSTDGLCRSFGEGGDGYVPGEGVGAILIKPLRQAIIDRDHIYAVIKGIAINHGGYTGGFTIPNTNAQADVMLAALEKANISAEEVTYIETHGTGTALGDPIEIAGLEKVYGNRKSRCKIGSIKSNLGHLEAAAGIASIAKVLLQFKNKRLYPSINAKILNKSIDWEASSLELQQDLQEWVSKGPRVSAISSFGAGGSNAHVILEEYQYDHNDIIHDKENIILISAKTKTSLKNWCIKFYNFLTLNTNDIVTLEQIAYSLQVGRESFSYKIAFICQEKQQLIKQIKEYIDTGYAEFSCEDSQNNDFINLLKIEEAQTFINYLVSQRKLKELILLWFADIKIDWRLLYTEIPRRINLPTYCFERKSYWIDDSYIENITNNPIQDMMFELLNLTDTDSLKDSTTLMEVGFSSIYALKLLNKINSTYCVDLKLPNINYNPSCSIKDFTSNINDLIMKAGETKGSQAIKNTNKEYFPTIIERNFEVKTILLTGATGNLGSGILYELLTNTKCKIICLIRGKNKKEAIEKMCAALSCFNSPDFVVDEQVMNVEILLGDISKERMGLDKNEYQRIANEVDMVLHAAAITNLNGDYETVSEVNITGTKEIIDFTLKTANKYLVFVSTHMIIGDKWYSESNLFYDEKMLNINQTFDGLGYQRSKYEAEIMVREATSKGLKWNIMRVGNVMGRSYDGAFPLNRGNCLYYDILKTVIDTHVALDTDLLFDITPVDFASKSIVSLGLRDSIYETYHVKNISAITMNDLYSLLQDLGISIEIVSGEEYEKRIDNYTSIFAELVKYNPIFRKKIKKSSVISCKYTSLLLSDMGIECPEIDEKLLGCYLNYCVNQGYISLDNNYKKEK